MNVEIRRGGKALPHWSEHRYCTSRGDLRWQIFGGLQFGIYKVEDKTKTLVFPDGKTTRRSILNHILNRYPFAMPYLDIRYPNGYRLTNGVLKTPSGKVLPFVEITRIFPSSDWE